MTTYREHAQTRADLEMPIDPPRDALGHLVYTDGKPHLPLCHCPLAAAHDAGQALEDEQ